MVIIFNEVLLQNSVRFDVVPTEGLLGSGSEHFIRVCIEKLGIQSSPASWTMERFCSPYFSTHHDEWRERITSAWHVKVVFDQPPAAERFRIGMRSLPVPAHDDTAPWDPACQLDWNDLPCVIIGVFPLGNWQNLDGLPQGPKAALAQANGVERLTFKGVFEQGRFHLGDLRFPEAEERVMAACEAIRLAGGSTNHREPIPRSRLAIPAT
jgi:hypothetical protein